MVALVLRKGCVVLAHAVYPAVAVEADHRGGGGTVEGIVARSTSGRPALKAILFSERL
jgi:hypothetical protein